MTKQRSNKPTLLDLLEYYMGDGSEYSPYALREAIAQDHQRFHSDATISRRMRDLRDRGYELSWRFAKNTSLTLYKIKKVDL